MLIIQLFLQKGKTDKHTREAQCDLGWPLPHAGQPFTMLHVNMRSKALPASSTFSDGSYHVLPREFLEMLITLGRDSDTMMVLKGLSVLVY